MTDLVALFPLTCPHRREGTDYCTYIQPAALRALVLENGQTPDELLLVALGCAAILFWSVQEQDLRSLVGSAVRLSLEELERLLKGVRRCQVIDRLLLDEARLAQQTLTHQEHSLSPLQVVPLEASQVVQEVTQVAMQQDFVLEETSEERLTLLSLLVTALAQHSQTFSSASNELSVAFAIKLATRTPSFFPVDRLHELTEASLAVCHTNPTNDERTFVVSHQIFEVWFAVVLATLQETIRLLQTESPDVLAAERLVRRQTAFFRHFALLIRLPETISAPTYLRFRPELSEVGSGAESIQFRALEIMLGQRDPQYRANLERMHLLTPELAHLFEHPSLQSAFAALEQAQPYSPELATLAEALVQMEQAMYDWRVAHLTMVKTMIGTNRPAMMVGGESVQGAGHSYLAKVLLLRSLFSQTEEIPGEPRKEPFV